MNSNKIEAHKVTKPIQLLAAWLVGLILVNGIFLATATKIENPLWIQAALVISAIINVPMFLGAIFVLQTKYRPQLQEDEFYAKYLDNATSEYVTVPINEELTSLISELRSVVIQREEVNNFTKNHGTSKRKHRKTWTPWKVALCDLLPDFDNIRSRLKDDGITIDKIFGSTGTDRTLDVNIISISRSVDFSTTIDVLRKMAEFKFDGYCYGNDLSKRVNREEIYLGGFGYLNGGYFPLNDELRSLLESDIEKSDLEYFESKHPRIQARRKPKNMNVITHAIG